MSTAFPVKSFDALFREVPQEVLAAALKAALEYHKPERYEDWGGGWLCACRDKHGERKIWPCAEVRAVITALGQDEPEGDEKAHEKPSSGTRQRS
jgi:hypothetical protein